MAQYIKKTGSELQVNAYKIKGMESNGEIFKPGRDSNVFSAQCSNCHTIVWLNVWTNPIINQREPEEIPDSGPEYQDYRSEVNLCIFGVLPACPNCGEKAFDHEVAGSIFARFPNGEEFNLDPVVSYEETELDSTEFSVWLLEDDPDNSIFKNAWIDHIESKHSNEEE